MKSIDFVNVRQPDDRTIIELSFKNAFVKMRLLGNFI